MRFATLGMVVVAADLCSCSSTTNNTVAPCGPGTTLVDGVCVVADSGAGSDGADTSDGTSNDSTGLDSTNIDSVVVDSSSDAGEASDSTDGASADEPCPSKVSLNCSTTCGALDPTCPGYQCQDFPPASFPYALVDASTPLPFVIRTPHLSDADPQCASESCTPALAFALAFKVTTPPTIRLRVRVGAPWTVGFYPATPGHPFCAASAGACMVLDPASPYDLEVFTADTAAPSRNIVIETAPSGTCP